MAGAMAISLTPSALHYHHQRVSTHVSKFSQSYKEKLFQQNCSSCDVLMRCRPHDGHAVQPSALGSCQISLNGKSPLKPQKSRFLNITCKATIDQASPSASPEVYQGMYGAWSVEESDIREVILYRAGLVTTAAAFVTAASAAFLPDDNSIKSLLLNSCDLLYAAGASGLGLSLFLIHIYVTPIKRTLQVLWAVGVLGSLGVYLNFTAPANQGLVEYVINHPSFIWAVGPLFASLTGLVFKEGLCYGKLEAAALVFVIPSLLLGHLAGLLDHNTELTILALWMGLFGTFAARKFTQPIKDDIGDKSVFVFNALPDEQKGALLMRIQRASVNDEGDT